MTVPGSHSPRGRARLEAGWFREPGYSLEGPPRPLPHQELLLLKWESQAHLSAALAPGGRRRRERGAVFPARVTHSFHSAICSPKLISLGLGGRGRISSPLPRPPPEVRLTLASGPQ